MCQSAVRVGAAPLRELRESQHVRRLAHQWPVADEHRFHVGAEGEQPAFGFLQPGVTPRLPIRDTGRGAASSRRCRPRPSVRVLQGLLLRSRAGREPGVVVELEQRHDRHRTGRARPDRELVLGREDVVILAHLDEGLVAGLAAQLDRVLAGASTARGCRASKSPWRTAAAAAAAPSQCRRRSRRRRRPRSASRRRTPAAGRRRSAGSPRTTV